MDDISKVSTRHINNIKNVKTTPSEKAITKLHFAAKILEKQLLEEKELCNKIKVMMKEKNLTLKQLATELNIDPLTYPKLFQTPEKKPQMINHHLQMV